MKPINVVACFTLVLAVAGSKFVLPASAAQASELLDGIRNSDVEVVRRSIDGDYAGVDVVVRENGGTLLVAAVGSAEIVRLLVDAGADVNDEIAPPQEMEEALDDSFGRFGAATNIFAPTEAGSITPLSVAAILGYAEIAEILLEAGANSDFLTSWGTPMALAAGMGHTDIVRLLIAVGADLKLTPGGLNSPLVHAVALQRTDVVRLLIEEGAYPCSHFVRQTTLKVLAEGMEDYETAALLQGARDACGN